MVQKNKKKQSEWINAIQARPMRLNLVLRLDKDKDLRTFPQVSFSNACESTRLVFLFLFINPSDSDPESIFTCLFILYLFLLSSFHTIDWLSFHLLISLTCVSRDENRLGLFRDGRWNHAPSVLFPGRNVQPWPTVQAKWTFDIPTVPSSRASETCREARQTTRWQETGESQ